MALKQPILKLYNTLSRKKEIFKPLKRKGVGLYACGPTVYNFAHLGNLRTFLFEDFLKRTLQYNGYYIKHVMNITDVGHLTSDADTGEDKMIKALKREGKKMTVESVKKIANFYTQAFKKDLEQLNINFPDVWCKATEHIPEMIKMIKKIEKNGYAYDTPEALYFDTQKFKNYGKLAQLKIEGLKAGARVKIDPNKKHPNDFALWFKAINEKKKHLMQWSSPWGKGWPGWHIECSAMSTHYLGQPFDLHCGGIDLIPVHHTNEIAQSETANQRPMAKFWMHGEFILKGKQKMSKSKGDFITLPIMISQGFPALAYRYLCLTAHYRSPLAVNLENIQSAKNALNNLYQIISDYPKINLKNYKNKILDSYLNRFYKAINNDLNLPQAMAIVWKLIKSNEDPSSKMATLFELDQILGLDLEKNRLKIKKIPEGIKKLIQKREELRKQKKWKESDRIRDKLLKKGWEIKDTDEKTMVYKK